MDTKKGDAGGRAVRVRKAHVRPGGLKEHGGLRTPRFEEGCVSNQARQRRPICPIRPICPTATSKMTEAQGMGTVERRKAPNGEVPRPLRSFVSSWRPTP